MEIQPPAQTDHEQNQNQPLTKKQRRELRRQEKVAAIKRAEGTRAGKRVLLWGGVLFALVLGVWGLSKLGKTDYSTRTTAVGNLTPVTERDIVKGNRAASLTLIEYSDLQCPACRAAYPAVSQLEREFGNDLRIVYRHFPLTNIHSNAEEAAQAAEAAGKQNRFWEMHDKLFDLQSNWANLRNPQAEFEKYAADLELNLEQFQADYNSKEIKDKIAVDRASGNSAGVSGTPSFYLNGQKLSLNGFHELRRFVQDSLPITTP